MSEQEQSLAESLNELEKLTQHALEVEGDERDQLIEQIKEKCEAEGLSSDEAEALIEEIGLVEANKRSADKTGGEAPIMQGSSQKASATDVSQNLKVPGSGTVPDPVTKKVKARKGDKSGGEMTPPTQGSSSMPKTKAEAMSRFYDTLGKMKKADIMDNYEKIMKAVTISEDTEEDYNPLDVKDDIDALTQGEDSLSEEFKEKATTIFEAAVQAKVKETLLEKEVQLEETFEARIEEEVKTIREELVEQVDGYLNYVSEQWVEDNKLAIEKGVRTEITESFITGMKNLFNEHYITIPEDKVDVVDDLFEKVEDLEKQLNDQINETMELTKQVNQYKKEKVVRTFSEGLSENQAEKLKKLSEATSEEESAEDFEEKVQVIKENYFPKQVSKAETLVEEVDVDNEVESEEQVTDEEVDDKMKNYMSAISRTLK